MRIYLAARYSRREEMLTYAKDLENLGHTVISRWITGCHEIPGKSESIGDRNTYTTEERAHFATEDLQDLLHSSCIIAFTEEENAPSNRGGRHVEFGYAIGKNLELYVVGPKENVFHCLPNVKAFNTWQDFLKHSELSL